MYLLTGKRKASLDNTAAVGLIKITTPTEPNTAINDM